MLNQVMGIWDIMNKIEKVIKDLTDSPKHIFTYGDVLRIIVKHFPELKNHYNGEK